MPEIPTLLEMLKSGLHFGHSVSKWHPKMEPYIFTARNGVHVLNLEATARELKKALNFAKQVAEHKGTIIFLGTKRQAQNIIKKYAISCGMPYIIERWMGGTLTNFSVISRLIRKYIDLKDKEAKGELEKYTKKEQHEFHREIVRLEKMIGGLEDLQKIPEAVFILDIKREKTALREAKRKKVPIIALCDTNTNPEGIDYVIPGNDDATKAIEMVVKLLAEAVQEGKAAVVAEASSKNINSKV